MPIFVLFVSAEVSFDGAFSLCVSLIKNMPLESFWTLEFEKFYL